MSGTNSVDGSPELVELNECSVNELVAAKVPGIGAPKAKRIVNERIQNGEFKDWDDVKDRVSGVGSKMIEKMKNNGIILSVKNVVSQHNERHGFTLALFGLTKWEPPNHFRRELKNFKFYMRKNRKRPRDDSS